MEKKLFAVSDVHGHYTELMRALKEAGFDENDPKHLFVSCGDLFDRGRENLRVYDFVRGLRHKILLKGNHENLLAEALARGSISETDRGNDTHLTIKEFLGEDAVDEKGFFDRAAHAEKIREITDFIDAMQEYLEADGYVLTHGWLPVVFEGRYPQVDPDWRHASDEAWRFAHELEWQQFYSVGATLEGKTIVCGHRPSRMGHLFDDSREPDCSYPFYGKGMIAIDAGTVRSGRVNAVVLKVSDPFVQSCSSGDGI